MNYRQVQVYFFLALLIGTLILAFFLFLPYMSALVLGGTLGVVFYPLYRRISRIVPPSIASLATITIALLIVLVPLILFSVMVFGEARSIYVDLSVNGASGLIQQVQQTVNNILPNSLSVNIESYLQQLTGSIADHLGPILSSFAGIFMVTFISLFALYYFLKDGERLKRAIIALSPLTDAYDEEIFRKLTVAVNTVIRGSISIALLQGVLAGIGFVVFGVPNPALWGGATVLAALLPAVGTALILGPATLYLFAIGNIPAFLGLAIWSIAVVGTVDNFVRPKLIGHGVHIHPFLILLSVLGGIGLFGPIGFLLGPLVLSMLFALLDIYMKEFRDYIQQGIE